MLSLGIINAVTKDIIIRDKLKWFDINMDNVWYQINTESNYMVVCLDSVSKKKKPFVVQGITIQTYGEVILHGYNKTDFYYRIMKISEMDVLDSPDILVIPKLSILG
jgi:hypothetical protein